MRSRSAKSASAETSAAVDEVDPRIPVDPSEVFLSRQAQWRSEAAKRRETRSAADRDFDGWFRGDTSSEAFSPANYGLKE